MRLIDADVLIKNFIKKRRPLTGADGSKDRYRYMQFLGDVEEIEHAPTIDAEPIIRCKDCALFYKVDGDINGRCGLYGDEIAIDSEWFCPNGRKEL